VAIARAIARETGVDEVLVELMPPVKLAAMKVFGVAPGGGG
jgi:hypothetical protein